MNRILGTLLIPLALAQFWWHLKVIGIEPKTGQKLYTYYPNKPSSNTHIVRRRKGYWHKLFGKDEIIPRSPVYARDYDINSLYPTSIK